MVAQDIPYVSESFRGTLTTFTACFSRRATEKALLGLLRRSCGGGTCSAPGHRYSVLN